MPPKEKDADDNENNDAIELTAESSSSETPNSNQSNNHKSKSKNKKKKNANDATVSIIAAENKLSDEDQDLKERLETCVATVCAKNDSDAAQEVSVEIRMSALNVIVTELRTATASMTSVPKPLKFLRPHYASLKAYYHDQKKHQNQDKDHPPDQTAATTTPTAATTSQTAATTTAAMMLLPMQLLARLADVLSVLAMTMATSERESLQYKLQATQWYARLKPMKVAKAEEKETTATAETVTTATAATATAVVDPNEEEYSNTNSNNNLGSWGHEYVRSLAGEIGQEYAQRVLDGADPEDDALFADLLKMVEVIVPFHVTHNAEAEAIDLLIEVQRLKMYLLDLPQIDSNNYQRICLYLIKTADYMSDPDDLMEMLETAYEIYRKQGQQFDALRVALRMDCRTSNSNTRTSNSNSNNNTSRNQVITELLVECSDPLMRKQMCLLLGRHKVPYSIEIDVDEMDTTGSSNTQVDALLEDAEFLNELIGNTHISEQFLKLAQDLDVVDAKTPEDIYKSHLAETSSAFSFTSSSSSRHRRDATGAHVDSARANLASTFVNAFVNAGFGQDKLMTVDNEWLYKNKDHGMMSAAASLGMIMLWNVEEGLTHIDKFLYSVEDYVKAGAALAVGIVSSGVRNEADPALALLTEHTEESSPHIMKCAACTGLGIAYAGSCREDVLELLVPVIETPSGAAKTILVEVSLAGLALGMIFVGSCDDTVGGTIVQRLMEATDDELNHSHARFLCLGLALLFLGQLEKAEAMIEAVRTIEHTISKYAVVMLQTCAYAGSGNVLQVQAMLHQCAEHLTEDAEHQMAAVIGIGLITMGESVGTEMALRSFDHLLHYCELPVKRAIPLSLAVLHISNPDFAVVDQLSRLSHDPDAELSQNAILAMGIVSSGTNNSRVAGLLRQLSDFYSKEASHVFCVRIAQGLLHMGKGLMTLNPFHSDKLLLNGPGLGGVLVMIYACLDLKNTLLDKSHYLLYYLSCALNPRMLITVNADIEWQPVTVRVGQALETVGQAGQRPRRITGFQTHQTPVLLATTERAELGTEEVISVSSVLEGVVIVKDNPDYEPEENK